MLSLLALLACTTASTGDSAVPDTLVCTATVNDTIRTVIGLDWEAPAGSTSWVEFGEDETYGLTTPPTTDTAVHRDLVGVPGDTDVHWRAWSDDGTTLSTCSGVTTTGTVDSDVPEVSVGVDGSGQDEARYFLGALFSGAGGARGRLKLVAYRRDGEVVWYHIGEEGTTGMDLHPARDGLGLLYNQFDGAMGGEGGSIHKITLAGEELASWEAPGAHHMFTELPDGTLTYQRTDTRSYTDPDTGETQDWTGDALVEIAPGGEATTVFSVWDTLTPRENEDVDHSIYPGLDWTHGNAVGYHEDTGEYLLSLAHANDVLLIDRETGAITTVWGTDGLPADPTFTYQHGVNRLPDGHLLMFMSEGSEAGAVEYEVTDTALTEVWRGGQGPRPFALGQAERLSNGNTMVNGGAGGTVREITPDDEIVWEIETAGAEIFAQFRLVTDLYTGR